MRSGEIPIISFGEFELDPARRSLDNSGEPVYLSAKAFDVLVFLVENAGRLITKEELLDSVWADQFVEQSNLTVQIHSLRKALGDVASEPRFLATIPGKGYQFIAPVSHRNKSNEDNVTYIRRDAASGFWADNRRWVITFGAAVLTAAAAIIWYGLGAAESGPAARSLAVLPFSNQTDDPGSDFLSDGLAEGVIFSLSRLTGLKVLSRESSFRFRDSASDAMDIGRRLGVHAILNGKITRTGNVVTVSTELVSTADNAVVWGDHFKRPADDVELLQGDIARAIANAMRVTLVDAAEQRINTPQTGDHEAYQLYLLGRFHLSKLTDDGFLKARRDFQLAIDRDPAFVLAYAGLAEANNLLSGWGAIDPNDGFPLAKAAALRALELDEGSAEAHIQLGTVRLFYEFDWRRADSHFQRAIELSAGLSDAHHMRVYTLIVQRRFAEAEEAANKALDQDPLALLKMITKGNIYLYDRKFDKALEQYNSALHLEPNSGVANWSVGNALIFERNYDQAIGHLERAVSLSGDSPDEPVSLVLAHIGAGNYDEGKRIALALLAREDSGYVGSALLAITLGALGETDRAFEKLELAARQRDPLLIFMRVDPMFDILRSDKRFEDLARRLDLP